MKSTTCETLDTAIVVFRVMDREVIALFPLEIADHAGHCTCYAHIGQHGAADYASVVKRSRPASPVEYHDLRRELEHIGYRLAVRLRKPCRGRG